MNWCYGNVPVLKVLLRPTSGQSKPGTRLLLSAAVHVLAWLVVQLQ